MIVPDIQETLGKSYCGSLLTRQLLMHPCGGAFTRTNQQTDVNQCHDTTRFQLAAYRIATIFKGPAPYLNPYEARVQPYDTCMLHGVVAYKKVCAYLHILFMWPIGYAPSIMRRILVELSDVSTDVNMNPPLGQKNEDMPSVKRQAQTTVSSNLTLS